MLHIVNTATGWLYFGRATFVYSVPMYISGFVRIPTALKRNLYYVLEPVSRLYEVRVFFHFEERLLVLLLCSFFIYIYICVVCLQPKHNVLFRQSLRVRYFRVDYVDRHVE